MVTKHLPSFIFRKQLNDIDNEQLQDTIDEIMIHEKYYALNKRCKVDNYCEIDIYKVIYDGKIEKQSVAYC